MQQVLGDLLTHQPIEPDVHNESIHRLLERSVPEGNWIPTQHVGKDLEGHQWLYTDPYRSARVDGESSETSKSRTDQEITPCDENLGRYTQQGNIKEGKVTFY